MSARVDAGESACVSASAGVAGAGACSANDLMIHWRLDHSYTYTRASRLLAALRCCFWVEDYVSYRIDVIWHHPSACASPVTHDGTGGPANTGRPVTRLT